MDELKEWTLVRREKGPDLPLFDVDFRYMKNPRNDHILKAVVLECPATINVIAIDKDLALIMVEQFRFGIGQNLLELPAGLIDPAWPESPEG